jgi:hypothetical protein
MSLSWPIVQRFVDGALTVRLGTLSTNGTPLITPLWYGREGRIIFIGTRRGSIHARHAAANPRVVMLFGDRHGTPTSRVLRVNGEARVGDYRALSLLRKARLAWRYFLQPRALVHWAAHWRRVGVRNRYYAERTDPSIIEITLGDAEFLVQSTR